MGDEITDGWTEKGRDGKKDMMLSLRPRSIALLQELQYQTIANRFKKSIRKAESIRSIIRKNRERAKWRLHVAAVAIQAHLRYAFEEERLLREEEMKREEREEKVREEEIWKLTTDRICSGDVMSSISESKNVMKKEEASCS